MFSQFNDSHRKALIELMFLIFLWGVIGQYSHLKNEAILRNSVLKIQEK